MSKISQHTVPKFYLKLFTPPFGDKVLWQHSKGQPYPRRVSPKKATAHAHVYSAQRTDGRWDQTLEDNFQRIEAAAAVPLKSLAEGKEPAARDRRIISFFIALMSYRVYGLRSHADAQADLLATPAGTIRYMEKVVTPPLGSVRLVSFPLAS
jgi:Protein of unknown function (DUF4238)